LGGGQGALDAQLLFLAHRARRLSWEEKYLTLVCQVDAGCRRLLYVGRERTATTPLRFFRDMGRAWCSEVNLITRKAFGQGRARPAARLARPWRAAGTPLTSTFAFPEDYYASPEQPAGPLAKKPVFQRRNSLTGGRCGNTLPSQQDAPGRSWQKFLGERYTDGQESSEEEQA
jgi:hypothetical protein